jgi:hypothetical protein
VLLRQHADEARSSQQVTQVDKEFFDSADVKTAEDIIRHVNATSKKGDERLIVLDEVEQIDHWERTVAVRDIISRHSIGDVPLLQDVTRFAMDNIGSPVSAKRIAGFLGAQRRTASVDTVLNYLAYLRTRYDDISPYPGYVAGIDAEIFVLEKQPAIFIGAGGVKERHTPKARWSPRCHEPAHRKLVIRALCLPPRHVGFGAVVQVVSSRGPCPPQRHPVGHHHHHSHWHRRFHHGTIILCYSVNEVSDGHGRA